jgi:hypothetical protein
MIATEGSLRRMAVVFADCGSSQICYRGRPMSSVPVMWVVWGVLLLVFIAFKVYVSRISQNEDDQLVLHDSSDHVRKEQEAIMAQLEKTKPVGRTLLGLLGVMTIYVAGYYVVDIVHQFK